MGQIEGPCAPFTPPLDLTEEIDSLGKVGFRGYFFIAETFPYRTGERKEVPSLRLDGVDQNGPEGEMCFRIHYEG